MPVDCTARNASAFAISPSEVDDTPCCEKRRKPHRGCVGAFLALLVWFFVPMFVNLQALDLHTFMNVCTIADDNINAAMGLLTFDH